MWITPFLQKKSFSKSYKLPISYWLRLWITHLLLVSYFTMFVMFTSMEKVLLSLGILNRKIKYFVNLLLNCKPIKLRPPWDAFWQHNLNQRNHISTYLTSLMAHVQSFEVLSTKCIWSPNFILIDIQLIWLKLDSLALYCHAWPLFGSHLCWSINHLCVTTLKRFLKSLMPPLEIWTKNERLTSKYDLFIKYHV